MDVYYGRFYTKTITDDFMTYFNKVQNVNKVTDEDFTCMDREITEIKKLRPLSPLNQDYKILPI